MKKRGLVPGSTASEPPLGYGPACPCAIKESRFPHFAAMPPGATMLAVLVSLGRPGGTLGDRQQNTLATTKM